MHEVSHNNFSANRRNCDEVNRKREECPVKHKTRITGEPEALPKRKQITTRMRHKQDLVIETGSDKELKSQCRRQDLNPLGGNFSGYFIYQRICNRTNCF
jgi:hypothetical protein